MKRTFVAVITEPLTKSGKPGFAVEINFDEAVAGMNGNTITIHLHDDATLDQAQALKSSLNELGSRFVINPR